MMAALLLFTGCQHFHLTGGHASRSARLDQSATQGAVRLDVADTRGDVVLSIPMQSDDSWCLLWNHSVAGFTVSDCFVNTQGKLFLYSSHQPDFAAGLGYLEGRGTLTSDGHGGYIITQIHEPVPDNSLVLRVGSKAVNHRVLYQGRETSLSQFVAGQRVTLRLSQD